MTDLMETLYEYMLQASYPAHLNRADYHAASDRAAQLQTRLQRELSPAGRELLESCLDALEQRHDLETQALFLTTLTVSRELWR